MCRPKGYGFCAFSVWKQVHFALFGLELGMVFRGNNGSVWTYLSFQFQMKRKEREICEIEMHFKKSFCSRSNRSRWHNFYKERGRPGLQTGVDFRRVYILPFLVRNWVGFSRELRECMKVLPFPFQMNKKEREICEFEMNFKKYFVCVLI